MKEVKIFVLALIALFSISSCIKDESGMSLKDGQKTFVKSTLSVRQLRQTISELEIKIGKETRAGAMDVTEDINFIRIMTFYLFYPDKSRTFAHKFAPQTLL